MILIVDDKAENIFSLKTFLETHSFEVDTATSGEEALKKVLKKDYALFILDVQMPGMDGFETAEAISGYSKTKHIPIIFLSAVNTDKKFITRGYSSGGIDYITKPIDPDILLLKVKTFYRLYEQTLALNKVQEDLRSEIEVRKKAQSEAQNRAQELHSILESIPQIAFTTRSNGKIEYVNQHWLNYSSSINRFPATHPDDPDIDDLWKNTIEKGVQLSMEVRIRKKDQEQYHYNVLKATPVKEDERIVKWVGTFTDIEDQKNAARKKDEFISITSHELKTPLTSIKAYVQLLERKSDPEDKNRVFISRTLMQIKKLETLIEDLLDISRIENGKLKFNKAVFNFNDILREAIEMIEHTFSDYNIIREGNADVEIYGDAVRIEQVVINYLTNAIKYSPEAKEIKVKTWQDNKRFYFYVRDYGIGISKQNQRNIFTKFYRVEESSKNFQGLGIGLYICSQIIKRHDGDFGLESEKGKGSTFFFSLPVASKTTSELQAEVNSSGY